MAISKRLRFRIFERDNFTCTYCGRRAPDVALEADHIHPRCQGGSDQPSNLTTACADCNRGKAGVPLAPKPRPGRACKGGPLDGTMLRGSPDRAVIWVFGKQDGAVVAVEDEWGRGGFDSEEVTEDDEDYGVRRLRFGHPGFGCGGLARNAPWQSEYAAQREPKLLGFYVTSEFTTGSSNEGMYLWWDMERMLVELSA